jgi:hypothetical protein
MSGCIEIPLGVALGAQMLNSSILPPRGLFQTQSEATWTIAKNSNPMNPILLTNGFNQKTNFIANWTTR